LHKVDHTVQVDSISESVRESHEKIIQK